MCYNTYPIYLHETREYMMKSVAYRQFENKIKRHHFPVPEKSRLLLAYALKRGLGKYGLRHNERKYMCNAVDSHPLVFIIPFLASYTQRWIRIAIDYNVTLGFYLAKEIEEYHQLTPGEKYLARRLFYTTWIDILENKKP